MTPSTKRHSRTTIKPANSTTSLAFQKKQSSLFQHGNRLFLPDMPSKTVLLRCSCRTVYHRHPPYMSLPSQESRQFQPQPNGRHHQWNQPRLNWKFHSRNQRSYGKQSFQIPQNHRRSGSEQSLANHSTRLHILQHRHPRGHPSQIPQPSQHFQITSFQITQSNQSDTNVGSSNRKV